MNPSKLDLKKLDAELDKILEGVDDFEVPMGVDQWRMHGKEYGYWKYFQGRVYIGFALWIFGFFLLGVIVGLQF